MSWLAALLISAAVFLLFPPDPARRLETILGSRSGTGSVDALGRRFSEFLGRARMRTAARREVIEALGALAAELTAGTPPQGALLAAGQKAWPAACGAVRFDGDVAEALRLDARSMPLLGPLAACWAISVQQGSGLSVSVARLAEQARIAEDVRVQLEAQLAGPRATARILMLLPLFGIAMGMMMGVNPLGWLLGTPLGAACLVSGICLATLGYWWTSRIVRRVEALL